MKRSTTFVGGLIAEAAQINRSGIELANAVRCTVGVAIPLALGLLTGALEPSVDAAIGAVVVGFASRQGVYRTQAAAMLFASAGMAAGTFVASVTSGNPLLDVFIAALWGYTAGLLASLGPAATAVGVNSIIALAVFGQFHLSPAAAGVEALCVLSGGLLQTLLCVLVWPLRGFQAERSVLAGAYRALASYAAHIPAAKLQPPDTAPFSTLAQTLADPQPFARRGDIASFENLLIAAERLRVTLAALATDRYVLESAHADEAATAVIAVCSAAASILDAVTTALETAQEPAIADDTWAALDDAIAALEAACSGEDRVLHLDRTRDDARALAGQLRSAVSAATTPVGKPTTPINPPRRRRPPHPRALRPSIVPEAFQTLRANVSLDSAYTQHGLRLAAVLAAAMGLGHVLGIQRAYWITITAVIVLRPDFSGTVTRGLARLTGTLVGGVIASAIALLHPGGPTLALLALLFVGSAYAVFNVNYAVFSAMVTAYVVFLLAFLGLPEHAAIPERIEATLLGGALAFVSYLAWPTWERAIVPARLAELLERQRRYSIAVLRAFLAPDRRDEPLLNQSQLEAWRARSNADTSVDRMLNEPVRPHAVTVRAALGVLAASRRYALATLSLRAQLATAAPPPPEVAGPLAALIEGLDRALQLVAHAVRHRTDPPPLPPLRELHTQLRAAVADRYPAFEPLLAVTDLMVDGVNAIEEALHRMHRDDTLVA